MLLFALGEALNSNTLAANLEETDDSIMRNEVKFFFKSKKQIMLKISSMGPHTSSCQHFRYDKSSFLRFNKVIFYFLLLSDHYGINILYTINIVLVQQRSGNRTIFF